MSELDHSKQQNFLEKKHSQCQAVPYFQILRSCTSVVRAAQLTTLCHGQCINDVVGTM